MTGKEYQDGQVLLIDKPINWTSFQAVNKIRWHIKQRFKLKKIKVGHSGTLDPLATGLVIICVGSHTKLINDLMGLTKQYTGTIRLGSTTPSYDLETEIDQTFDLPENDSSFLSQIAGQFEGNIERGKSIKV